MRNLTFHQQVRIPGSLYTRLPSSLAHLGHVQLLTCLKVRLLCKIDGRLGKEGQASGDGAACTLELSVLGRVEP